MSNYQDIADALIDDYGGRPLVLREEIRDALAEARHDGAAVMAGIIALGAWAAERHADHTNPAKQRYTFERIGKADTSCGCVCSQCINAKLPHVTCDFGCALSARRTVYRNG